LIIVDKFHVIPSTEGLERAFRSPIFFGTQFDMAASLAGWSNGREQRGQGGAAPTAEIRVRVFMRVAIGAPVKRSAENFSIAHAFCSRGAAAADAIRIAKISTGALAS
jgi:hypothetical protein